MSKTNSLPPLIVALDVESQEAALALADQLLPRVKLFKVGSGLFTRCGPEVVAALRSRGAEIFLDLKFHDIPNTVAACCRAAADLDVFMMNLHLTAGGKVVREAVKALTEESAKKNKRRPLLLGVTILTHLGKENLTEVGWDIPGTLQEKVGELAQQGKAWGLDGVVCSPREITEVRAQCGTEFCIVTPGIRPAGAAHHDQKRTLTPQEALAKGANFIVVGRPILESENPTATVSEILQEVS